MTQARVWKVLSVCVATGPQTHESGWLHVCFISTCYPSVYEQSKQKQTVSADRREHARTTSREWLWTDQNPEYSWVTSEKNRSAILCAYFCMWADIYSLFTPPPPPLHIAPQLFPCLSVRICHRHPAQPGGPEHPAFSHSTLPTPAGLHRSQEASLLIRDLIECVFWLLHVWSFSCL